MREVPIPSPHAVPAPRALHGIPPALVLLAALFDGLQPLHVGAITAVWLDVAALACVAWALFSPRLRRDWSVWSTPFDGRILAAVVIAALQALPAASRADAVVWLQQMLACGAFFYALTMVLRGRDGLGDSMWSIFGFGGVVVGLHALFAATSGLETLRAEASAIDAAWAAHHGLAKAMLFLAVLMLGRALEPGASARWRVSALIGVVGCLLHAAAGGFGLDPHSLGRLDEPLYFSATAVLLLTLFGLVRRAWEHRRARPLEARRWRAMAAGFTLLAVFGLFGETTGGEGVRVLAVLAAVTVLAVEPMGAAGAPRAGRLEADEAPLRQAA